MGPNHFDRPSYLDKWSFIKVSVVSVHPKVGMSYGSMICNVVIGSLSLGLSFRFLTQ